MAFDTLGPLNRLATILAQVPNLEQVYIGVPTSVGPKVIAYVTVGAQSLPKKAGQVIGRRARYVVTFAYYVPTGLAGVAAAETALAGGIDAFIRLVYAERNNPASALFLVDDPDLSLADSAEYQAFIGQEFRRYPIVVTVSQQETFTLA